MPTAITAEPDARQLEHERHLTVLREIDGMPEPEILKEKLGEVSRQLMNANELLEAIAARVYRVTSHEEDWPTVTFEQIGVLMTETYWLGKVANFITENASKITEASNKDLAAIARWGHMESMPAFDEHGHRAEYGEGL